MEYDKVVTWLESNGWKEVPVFKAIDKCDRNWIKRFPGEPRCKTNEDRDIFIQCKFYSREGYGSDVGVQLELRGEPVEDKGFVIFEAFSIDQVEDIPRHCERLLKAWRAICE